MDLRFVDDELSRVETDEAVKTKLPTSVIVVARRKLLILRSAQDEKDLRNWKSLLFEKHAEDQLLINLTNQWKLFFSLDDSRSPQLVTVLSIRASL